MTEWLSKLFARIEVLEKRKVSVVISPDAKDDVSLEAEIIECFLHEDKSDAYIAALCRSVAVFSSEEGTSLIRITVKTSIPKHHGYRKKLYVTLESTPSYRWTPHQDLVEYYKKQVQHNKTTVISRRPAKLCTCDKAYEAEVSCFLKDDHQHYLVIYQDNYPWIPVPLEINIVPPPEETETKN